MTMNEHISAISELCDRYNAEMTKDVVNARVLTQIENQLKDAAAEAKAARKAEVYAELQRFKNPMLEAARVHEFDCPSYTLKKIKGVVVGAEPVQKTVNIGVVEFSHRIIKESELKSCTYERTGVVKSGHSWEYRCEKLAYLLTYRTIQKLGGTPTDIDEFKNTYAIRDIAVREKMGETPTSNTQLVKQLQGIIDLLVFVPDEKGNNAVKCNGKDAEYLLSVFEKAGRGAGVVEVLKGSKIKDYIFTVCHMIVTGKKYEVSYGKRKDDVRPVTIVRKPVKPQDAATSPEVLTSEAGQIDLVTPIVAPEVSADDLETLPSLSEIA